MSCSDVSPGVEQLLDRLLGLWTEQSPDDDEMPTASTPSVPIPS
jgi:hypothetical protein